MSKSLVDYEREFLIGQLGVSGVGKTLDDLRYEFYQGVVDGTISIGGAGGGSSFDTVNTWRAPYAQANGGTGVQTGGQMVLAPVQFPETLWLSGMGFRVQTAGAGSTMFAVLYEDTGNFLPGALSKATAALDCSSTGVKSEEFSGFEVFSDRIYWAGILPIGATPPNIEASSSMSNVGRPVPWTGMPYGTGSAPVVNAGNDGQIAAQTGLATPPSVFGGSYATDKNGNKIVPWMVFKLTK